MKLEEDTTWDDETNHIPETISLLAIGGSGVLGGTAMQTPNQAPTLVGPLSATHVGKTQATIQWEPATDPDGDPISYELQIRKDDLSDSWSDTISTIVTSHTFTDLQPNTTYRARIRAFDG